MTVDLRSKPGHLIWRAYQLTWQVFAQEADRLDITPVQEAMLHVVSERPGIDQKTLADTLALDRSTAGDVLDRLQKRGLVNRVENDLDRRERLVSLTDEGKALSKKLKPIALDAANRILSPLAPEEQNEFKRLLRLIVGLADPFDHVSTPAPAKTRLNGKQVLCVGLSGTIGETIVHRLQSEGAEIAEMFPLNIPASSSAFRSELKKVQRRFDEIELLINGGNFSATPAQSEAAYAEIQSLVHSRLLALQAILPHFVKRNRGGIINLALFPSYGKSTSYDDTAVISANAAILSLSQNVANSYRASGIVCNCLSPREQTPNGKHDRSFVDVPAMDIALAASYLASDEARSVSASNIILG